MQLRFSICERKVMKQTDNPMLTIFQVFVSLVTMLLLLLIYMSIGDASKELRRLNENVGALDNKMSRMEKRKSTSTPQVAMTNNVSAKHVTGPQRWLNRGKPYPLREDPYFQNLSRGTKKKQSLVVRVSSDEKGFNRVRENSAQVSEWHNYYVNDLLAKRHWGHSSKWSPQLAIRVEISDDNKEFTVYLRRGVRWHEPQVDWNNPRYQWLKGDHYVTSHDFYFAYTTIMNKQVNSAFMRPYYEDIESFEIIDDYTFVIRWKKTLFTNTPYTLELFPVAEFLYSRDEFGNKFPEETFAQEFNEHWYNDRMIGCGPYKFKDHKQDQYTEFVRNEDYFGYKPAIERVRFVVVKDNNTAYIKIKGQELNLIQRLEENVYRDDIFRKNPKSPFQQGKLVAQIYPRMVYYHIKWNNAHPIFRDKMVRRAMTHAFNREGVLKNICMGLGYVATGGVARTNIHYNKNIQPYAYDLQKAQQILLKQGWKDEDGDGILEKTIDGVKTNFEFALHYFGSYPVYRDMYGIYREDLLKIGVKMTPRGEDWPLIQKRYEDKDFDAIHGVWLTAIPLDFYQIWHSKGADEPKSSNSIRYKNAEVDDICQKMREAIEVEERIKLAHRIQEIWHDEQPYTFLFFRKGVAAFTNDVANRYIRTLRPHILIHPYYVK